MKQKILQLLSLFGAVTFFRNLKGEQITVLCLHKIADESDHFFNPITIKQFEGLVKYCIKYYSIVSFKNIEEKKSRPKLIFSFDDGYSDFIENAIPVLHKYKIPSNHNIVNVCVNDGEIIWTQKLIHLYNHFRKNEIKRDAILASLGHEYKTTWLEYGYGITNHFMTLPTEQRDENINLLLDKYQLEVEEKMMTWDDIKVCERDYQVEIGSHTYTHRTLNNVTDKDDLDIEIKKSITEIEDNLNHSIDVFCLPRGQYNETVIDYLRSQTNVKYVLLVNDDTNAIEIQDFNLVNRIYMINEPASSMILRTELFQKRVKKLVGRA